MRAKTFFIANIIMIAIVAAIASYISMFYLIKPILLANPDQGGYVNIGVLSGGGVNVIIVDSTVTAGISDTVTFPSVVRGTAYNTLIPFQGMPSPVEPFLIRNIGTDPANVEIYAKDTKLFTSTSSTLKAYIETTGTISPPFPTNPWLESASTCFIPSLHCFTSASCTSTAKCTIPFSANGLGTDVTRPLLLTGLKALDDRDEAVMHIEIMAATDEPTGTKATTVVIVGSQT